MNIEAEGKEIIVTTTLCGDEEEIAREMEVYQSEMTETSARLEASEANPSERVSE